MYAALHGRDVHLTHLGKEYDGTLINATSHHILLDTHDGAWLMLSVSGITHIQEVQ